MTDRVVPHLEDGLLTITLNATEQRNALSMDVAVPLLAVLRGAATNPQVRAVLLEGAGSHFCVGGNVAKFGDPAVAPPPIAQRQPELREIMESSRLIYEMPKPVVVAIQGAAAGAGLSLALACDLRIAGENAKLTTAFAKVGVSGDFGGTYFLTQLLGSARARELYLLSPVLTGSEAAAIGLVTRAVPDTDVKMAARDLARSLAQGPTVTYGYIKANIRNAETASLAACLDAEALHHCCCLHTADQREASAAFLQKRAPIFSGR